MQLPTTTKCTLLVYFISIRCQKPVIYCSYPVGAGDLNHQGPALCDVTDVQSSR